ncbi:MAG: hypothetical protein E7K72_19290, partial [Roseomonas mucosa]|nr:hypothetical protein [Roseomonas mucosa]
MFDAEACSFLSISDMLKATPGTDGDARFLYFEASNESVDAQGEVVLAKALADSIPYFLRYGNLDIDHVTQIGARKGIPDYNSFEIGVPRDAKADGKRIFAKCELYRGDSKMAEKANEVWDSLTRQAPPARWYPSVGGAVKARGTAQGRPCVSKVLWNNIGISRTPVNLSVPTVGTVPFGVLAKSWSAEGFDLGKALSAGYGGDSATLTGGAALGRQSLDGTPYSYQDFRERMS